MNCPYCQSVSLVKRGKNHLRFETVQTYSCKQCGRRFSERSMNNKTYPAHIIYHALVLYHQGLSLEGTRREINKRFKIRLGISTVHSWAHEYTSLSPIATIRRHFAGNGSGKVLFQKRFEHENLNYEFMVHTYKLETKVRTMFPGLYQYLTRFEQGCPKEFFEIGKRCSQPIFNITANAYRTKNMACSMAAFSMNAAKKNNQRHKYVEEFMLVNDTATIACEIPVWYWACLA